MELVCRGYGERGGIVERRKKSPTSSVSRVCLARMRRRAATVGRRMRDRGRIADGRNDGVGRGANSRRRQVPATTARLATTSRRNTKKHRQGDCQRIALKCVKHNRTDGRQDWGALSQADL